LKKDYQTPELVLEPLEIKDIVETSNGVNPGEDSGSGFGPFA